MCAPLCYAALSGAEETAALSFSCSLGPSGVLQEVHAYMHACISARVRRPIRPCTHSHSTHLPPLFAMRPRMRARSQINVSQADLQSRLSELERALGVEPEEARRMVLKHTAFVTMEGSVEERVEALAVLLPVSRSKLVGQRE
jgi:hypothetical protein